MAKDPTVIVTEEGVGVRTRPTLGLRFYRRFVNPSFRFEERLEWAAVTRARAYKRASLVTDLICVLPEAPDAALEVNEEMEGWEAFLAALPRRLPGCLDGGAIWRAVAQPPFATNETVVFERR